MIISQAWIVHYFSFHTYSCFIAPRITRAYLKCSGHAQVCDLLIHGTCWLTFYLSSNTGWQVNIAFFVWGEGSLLKLSHIFLFILFEFPVECEINNVVYIRDK